MTIDDETSQSISPSWYLEWWELHDNRWASLPFVSPCLRTSTIFRTSRFHNHKNKTTQDSDSFFAKFVNLLANSGHAANFPEENY